MSTWPDVPWRLLFGTLVHQHSGILRNGADICASHFGKFTRFFFCTFLFVCIFMFLFIFLLSICWDSMWYPVTTRSAQSFFVLRQFSFEFFNSIH